MTANKILLADDDSSFLQVMLFNLTELGYQVDTAEDGVIALTKFKKHKYPLVITDVRMPRMDGLALLNEIKILSPETLVIVVTAFGEVDVAVNAMKAGAFDFIPKPCNRDHFRITVKKALEHIGLKQKVKELQTRLDSSQKKMLYKSEKMSSVISLSERVAETDATVLIQGESGTGKELLARHIHKQSPRSSKPFVAVNCAAIPRDLLESELFGHVKGAFTGVIRNRKGKFEQAGEGTLFLDEIAELPVEVQPRLLRALQENKIDLVGGEKPVPVQARIITATNRDLDLEVKEGRFREDLFFRVNIFPITLPPLRERRGDILVLIHHFLDKYGKGKSFTLSKKVIATLEALDWPGNVRELENICQRLVIQADGEKIDETLLPDNLHHFTPGASQSGDVTFQLPKSGFSLVQLEKEIIEKSLEINQFNQTKTAKYLGIARHVLLYRLEKYGIDLKGRRG